MVVGWWSRGRNGGDAVIVADGDVRERSSRTWMENFPTHYVDSGGDAVGGWLGGETVKSN